ncbi:hypothetical protein JH67_03080 [Listeria monocytogenes]|nr:hypothetical protein [Listeria monocytogenes]
MTKIVRMSEKAQDGSLQPFYPETHVQGLVGANSWQKFPTSGPDGILLPKLITDWHKVFTEVTDSNSFYLDGTNLDNAPDATSRYWSVQLVRVNAKCGVVLATSLTTNVQYVATASGAENSIKWSAWKQIASITDLDNAINTITSNRNVTAWTGGYHMDASKVVTPSVSLADCKEWIIYWSKYSGGEAEDYYFYTQVVTSAQMGGHSMMMKMDNVDIYKYLYISNTTITGSAGNMDSPNTNAVMRKVVAVK